MRVAADVGVVALDREALEADPVDAVALIARGVAGHMLTGPAERSREMKR